MNAITTKFHGPTNALPSRLSCRDAGRTWRVYVSYDHGSTDLENHTRALAKYCHKHFSKHAAEPDLWIPYHYGHTNEGMVFVMLTEDDHARDTVWVNNANGAYMLQEPLECKRERRTIAERMTDCIVLFQRDKSFDTHEVGAYRIIIVTMDGNARGIQLTRSEALSIYLDMQVEFDE